MAAGSVFTRKINATWKDVLFIEGPDNEGLLSSYKRIMGGNAVTTPFYLSQNSVKIDTYLMCQQFRNIGSGQMMFEANTGANKWSLGTAGSDDGVLTCFEEFTLKTNTNDTVFTTSSGTATFNNTIIGDLQGDVTGNVTGDLTGDVSAVNVNASSTVSAVNLSATNAIITSIGGTSISLTGNITANSLTGPLTGDVVGNVTGNVVGNITSASTVMVNTSYDPIKYALTSTDDDISDGIASGNATLKKNVYCYMINATGEIGANMFDAVSYVKAPKLMDGSSTIYQAGVFTGDVTGDLTGTADDADKVNSSLTVDNTTLGLSIGTSWDGSANRSIFVKDEGITLDKLPHINQYEFIGRATAGSGDPEILTASQARSALGNIQENADETALNTCDTPNVISDWNAAVGDAVILNKPTIPSTQKHFMQWSMKWTTDANPGNSGTDRRQWFTIDKTYGTNDMYWNSYSTGTNPPTAWYDSQIPGIIIPDTMTLKAYTLYGTITLPIGTASGNILLEIKKNTNPITWTNAAQSLPMTTLGSRQTQLWTHQCYTKMGQSGLSVSFNEGDMIIPHLARDFLLDSSTAYHIEGIFVLEFERSL